MAVPLKVPEVGESITEVEIGEWLKSEGDRVERDEELVVIETEKATVQISAPQSGTLVSILKQTGETARVGETIAHLDQVAAEGGARPINRPAEAVETADGAKRASSQIGEPVTEERTDPGEPIEITPDAKKEEEIDRASEQAQTARDAPIGRPDSTQVPRSEPTVSAIFDDDDDPAPRPMRQRAGQPREDAKPEVTSAPAPTPHLGETYPARPEETETARAIGRAGEAGGREEKLVRMTPLRRRIAERLVQAQQTAALLTTFNEIEMTTVIALRERYRDAFKTRYNVKLGFMSFFVKASIDALKRIPEVNAEIRGDEIVYRNFFDIGIAVGGGKGLVVPVLRNAERLSFAAVERAIADFARRAQENRLTPDELQGGTFTISNGGIYGSLLSTPIINPPQSGILGMHSIQERPVVRDGAVAVRPMMYVALTYDHRVIDGREAVRFLKHIKEVIEDPAQLLFEI